jgi:hypothetical protein
MGPGAHVHHVNGDQTDDRIENLEEIERTVHERLHMNRERKNMLLALRGLKYIGPMTYTCEWCHGTFERRPRKDRPHRFCGHPCRIAWLRSTTSR